MKNLEVILNNRNTKKLTITPTRITIKLPAETSEADVEHYKELSLEIDAEMKPEQAWRGNFRPKGIMMYTQNKGDKKFFNSEEPC